MNNSINKYGLNRYIPSDIREKIRKDAGFGCVICGCVLVDYEHIEPEFHEAKEHDPEKMTLLCISCHGRVTRKLLSKKIVWKAKENPKSQQDGYVHDLLFINTENMEIKIGNSSSKKTKIVLSIHGKPIIWFEPPLQEGEPSKLCAILYGNNGKIISYINRNQFIALSDNQDIKSESTRLSIITNNIKTLEINREGGEAIQISKMEFQYLDTSIAIDNEENLIIRQGNSNFTLGKFYVENCGAAISIGAPLGIKKYKKLPLAITLAINKSSIDIKNIKGEFIGWALRGEIFNKSYELVGLINQNKVFSLANEFIGKMVDSYISHDEKFYETGEPIYISKENSNFKNQNPQIGYDVSFRLFGSCI